MFINDNGDFEMWFSYRSGSGEKYRIGYISTGRVQDYTLTFVNTPDDRWIIQPKLPDNLP